MTPYNLSKKISFNEPKYLSKILDELTNILQLDKNRIENVSKEILKIFLN